MDCRALELLSGQACSRSGWVKPDYTVTKFGPGADLGFANVCLLAE